MSGNKESGFHFELFLPVGESDGFLKLLVIFDSPIFALLAVVVTLVGLGLYLYKRYR